MGKDPSPFTCDSFPLLNYLGHAALRVILNVTSLVRYIISIQIGVKFTLLLDNGTTCDATLNVAFLLGRHSCLDYVALNVAR